MIVASTRASRTSLAAALLAALFGCAGAPRSSDEPADNYLRWIAYEEPLGGEFFVVRWPQRKLPLKVHLPPPPAGLFEDPQAIHDSVKDGIFDWTGVAAPGVPGFVLVEHAGLADIPIVWAEQPTGDWFIAFCVYEPSARSEFRVSHILVTARYADGTVADRHQVYHTMLHEMGHALGMAGHSPFAGDIMYPKLDPSRQDGLSPRDRATLAELYRLPIGKRVVGGRRSR